MSRLLGAIEAGGTKFVCGIGDPGGSRETATFPTRDPDATFADVAAFFGRHDAIAAIGIASFGPIRIDRAAPDHGRMLRTPKPHWEGVNMVARVHRIANVPIGLDTDVNAAALAEARASGLGDLCYVTVGTGVGVGVVSDGRALHGAGHPEAGHMLVRRHRNHDFPGLCPFHGDCLEGMASGPALTAAWQRSATDLADDHPAWSIEADYLAQLCMTLVLTLAPRRIVLGGGVMRRARLLGLVQKRTHALLNGYAVDLDRLDAVERLIRPPACPEPPGLIGAYLLAAAALADKDAQFT